MSHGDSAVAEPTVGRGYFCVWQTFAKSCSAHCVFLTKLCQILIGTLCEFFFQKIWQILNYYFIADVKQTHNIWQQVWQIHIGTLCNVVSKNNDKSCWHIVRRWQTMADIAWHICVGSLTKLWQFLITWHILQYYDKYCLTHCLICLTRLWPYVACHLVYAFS